MENKDLKGAEASELKQDDFLVECNACGRKLHNWTGSTPCCGSIAYLVEDGKVTDKISMFASVGGQPIKPTVIDFGKTNE